jgi:CDP-diacylglycerol--serine O-phosphatidyltransferase
MNVADLKPKSNSSSADNRTSLVGFHKMIPNLMTLTAMAAGLTAIQYAINGRWELSVIAILIACILDAMDGATARILKAQSEFGAQLDSLSDFLAFGVAPAIILYTWLLEDTGKIGWMAMIIYAAATALRLARFNVAQKEEPTWKKGFFSGVPSPAGAGLALLPVILWLQLPDFFEQFAIASPLVALWTIFVAGLMVSRIPTYSSKKIKVPAKLGMPALAFAVIMVAALVHAPWQTLTIATCAYIISVPFAIQSFRKLQKEFQDEEDMTDLAIGASAIDDYNTFPEKED